MGQTAPVPQMFDVCSCMKQRLDTTFDRVVKALTSNDGTYANEIVLIFERPLSGVQPKNRPPFACSFEIPAKGIVEYGTVNMKFKPLLTDSELVTWTSSLSV